MTRKPPVFILGAQRSGTTMCRLMLDSHPHLAVPFETDFVLPYYYRLDEFGDLSETANVRGLLEDVLANRFVQRGEMKDLQVDEILSNLEGPTYADVVDAVFRTWAASRGKPRWGDKDPGSVQLHVLNQLFPEALFLHVIRDGRDVAVSRMNVEGWGQRSVLALAHHWCWTVAFLRQIGRTLGDRYREVRYEALVREPEATLRDVCAWMGEPFDARMLAYAETAADRMPADLARGEHKHSVRPPDPAKIGAWKRRMGRGDRAVFQAVARRLLRDLDYELEDRTLGYRLARRVSELKHALLGRATFPFPGLDRGI